MGLNLRNNDWSSSSGLPVHKTGCRATSLQLLSERVIFPCSSVAALSTTCPHFCPRGLQVPPYCTLEPARGWLLENPVPRKVRKVSPRSVRFFTLLIMLRFVHPPCAL